MTQLVGRHERSIDANGRLTLPAKFAAQFGGSAFVHDDPEGCVRLFLSDDYKTLTSEMVVKMRANEISRDDVRAFTSASQPVTIDKQGRLTIDDNSRRLAGIETGSDVIVIGVVDSVEIWRPSRADTKVDEGNAVAPRRQWDDEVER